VDGYDEVYRVECAGTVAFVALRAVTALGAFIDSLGGRYHCGPDLGFTAEDGAALSVAVEEADRRIEALRSRRNRPGSSEDASSLDGRTRFECGRVAWPGASDRLHFPRGNTP